MCLKMGAYAGVTYLGIHRHTFSPVEEPNDRVANFQDGRGVRIGKIDQNRCILFAVKCIEVNGFLCHASVRQDIKACVSRQKLESWHPSDMLLN